jgi:multisubunit Na+/H+ antiporter MnhB subunit
MQDWASERAPYYGDHVLWGGFILQTVFACVLAAIIMNIRWRWRRKEKIEKPHKDRDWVGAVMFTVAAAIAVILALLLAFGST